MESSVTEIQHDFTSFAFACNNKDSDISYYSVVIVLTDAGFGVVAEQPTLRTETFGFAQVLIQRDAAIIATATTYRGYDKDLARARMSCSFEVNVSELLIGV